MHPFLVIYLIILALSIVVTAFIAGFNRKKMSRGDLDNFIFQGLVLGIGWPILIMWAIIIAPFYGIYQLGKFFGSRQ